VKLDYSFLFLYFALIFFQAHGEDNMGWMNICEFHGKSHYMTLIAELLSCFVKNLSKLYQLHELHSLEWQDHCDW